MSRSRCWAAANKFVALDLRVYGPMHPVHAHTPTPPPPTDDAIEAVIQHATAARGPADPRPLRDTRTQLFVGNVRPRRRHCPPQPPPY